MIRRRGSCGIRGASDPARGEVRISTGLPPDAPRRPSVDSRCVMRLCALEHAVGRAGACPESGCPFWEPGGAVLPGRCAFEQIDLRPLELADELLQIRVLLECRLRPTATLVTVSTNSSTKRRRLRQSVEALAQRKSASRSIARVRCCESRHLRHLRSPPARSRGRSAG